MKIPTLFLRFAAAGLLNTLFGYAIFAGLLLLGVNQLAALILAAAAGTLFNFQTSRLVFRSRGRALRFVAVYAAVLALNWSGLRAAVHFGLAPLPAQALLCLPVATLSFIGQKFFVFGAMPVRA
jgi:putative flippase GtrA